MKGFKGFFKKIFRRQSIIARLFTDISTFEGQSLFNDRLLSNAYNEIFSVKDQVFFKTFIDQDIDEKYDYPVKQTSDLVSFFESRRVKNIEIIIALIASMLGGAIGAILTMGLKITIPNILHK